MAFFSDPETSGSGPEGLILIFIKIESLRGTVILSGIFTVNDLMLGCDKSQIIAMESVLAEIVKIQLQPICFCRRE